MSATQESSFAALFPREYYAKFFDSQCRPDGRSLTGLRSTTVSVKDILGSAAGSSLVKIGGTSVMCGINLEVGAPATGKPSSGFIFVTVNTPALCSADAASSTNNTDREQSNAALGQFITSLLLDSGLVRLSSLGIIEGVAAWYARADIVVLNDDGNVRDAAILAAAHAFASLELPETVAPDEKEVFIVPNGVARSLGLSAADLLVPLTVAHVGGALLTDPTVGEEALADDLCTVVFNAKGAVAGVYKPGGVPLSQEVMTSIVKLAAKRAGGWFRDAREAVKKGSNDGLVSGATDL